MDTNYKGYHILTYLYRMIQYPDWLIRTEIASGILTTYQTRDTLKFPRLKRGNQDVIYQPSHYNAS